MRLAIAVALVLFPAGWLIWQSGVFDSAPPKETDFKPFSAAAASARGGAFLECTVAKDLAGKYDRQIAVMCMERKGYSYDPR